MSPFRLAVLNLVRRPVPTFIAILSIALSVALSGILLRLDLVSENRFSALGRGGDAIVGAKAGGIDILLGALGGEGSYPGFLPYRLFQSLEAEESVRFEDGVSAKPSFIKTIIPFVYFGQVEAPAPNFTATDSSSRFRVIGTSEKFFKRTKPDETLSFKEGAWSNDGNTVILGSEVARVLGFGDRFKLGDTISVQPWAGEISNGVTGGPPSQIGMKVVGVLQPSRSMWDRELFSNIATAQQTLATLDLSHLSIWGPQVLNYFLLDLEPAGFAPLESLVNRRTVGQAILISEQKARLEQLTGTGKKLGLFVMILTLALGALSVGSMLLTRFEAMALQLAVLRALGYKRNIIGRWLIWEGCLLGVCACLIGISLDLAGFPVMRSWLGAALPPADLVPSSVLQSAPVWLVAIAATTASVIVPMYRVYRQDIHYSLRD